MIKALEEQYPLWILNEQNVLSDALCVQGTASHAESEFIRGQIHGLEAAKHEFNEMMRKMRGAMEELRDE